MNSKVIHAEPTKEFFVEMITRDIPLNRAILDLIDNSVDGAHRTVENENFEGLYVKLYINGEQFKIEDNCGGIPLDIAVNQAFRFGKTKDYKVPEHSIGRFGIGMKRALFKIGNHFKVQSVHNTTSFTVDVNISEWLENSDEWDFEFSEEAIELRGNNTVITIDALHEEIGSEFSEAYFIEKLKNDIAIAHSLILKKGFQIYVNDVNITRKPFPIKYGTNLKPFVNHFTYKIEDKEVNITVLAGVDKRDINAGGWYIFCNDRLVLDADKSTITGWNSKVSSSDKINKYHPDYAYFRGYIIFDSSDASLLPWTTTKTGLDHDSMVYKAAFFEMRKAMKQVIIFLQKRALQDAKFKKEEIDSNPLTTLIENETGSREFITIEKSINMNFYYNSPEPNILKTEPSGGTITYWKPKEELDMLKNYLGVTTNSEVGKITFDYYLSLIKD